MATWGGFFGGPDLSGYHNPFKGAAPGSFDRQLFEQNQGTPAIGYFAGQSGTPKTFSDWILGQQGNVQKRYQGEYAIRNDPTYALTDWMANWDPVSEYNQQTQTERGQQGLSMSPFVKR